MNALIKILPELAGTLMGGPLGGLLAGKATSWVAKKLGIPEEDTQAIQDAVAGMNPMQRVEFEADLSKWIIEQQNLMYAKELEDLKDARARDVEFTKSGTRNYRADAITVFAFLGVSTVLWMVWKDPNINEFIKGIVTLVMGRFLGYIDQIFSFEFGSTRSSRSKDNTIETLTSKGK
jgi:hypothetical protein